MAPLLFLSSTFVPSQRLRAHRVGACRRRPRPRFVCAASPDEPREIGDPSWMDLARSLGASDTDADPEPQGPKWKLPDDEPPSEESGKSAWAAWNAAVAKADNPAEDRDPQKETDFWRSAARDMIAPDSGAAPEAGEGIPEGAQTGDQPNTELPEAVEDATSSTDIWRMARGVTGEMSSLQERLRADLENFNPDEHTDQYRDIARELVGPPPEEPWDNVEPVRGAEGEADPAEDSDSNQDVEAGSGWNPDVDWMRFEDLRREQAKKLEADARKEVEKEAQEKKLEAVDRLGKDGEIADVPAQGGVTYTDESGRVLTPEEVEQARREGAVFVDEAGAQIDASHAPHAASDKASPAKFDAETGSFPDGNVPGFIANRFKSRGTYGSGYAGMEEDVQALREQGIPLRDPKADAEQWRSAARELNITVDDKEADSAGLDPNAEDDILAATPEDEAIDVATKTTDESVSSVAEETDESSSWSAWREGTAKWQKAAASAKSRDLKAEVDMWRTSARELTGGDEKNGDSGAEIADGSSFGEASAWDSWRSANANWESGVAKANESSSADRSADNPWISQGTKSDWGAGLDGKTSSDRSAWENWNNVKGENLRAGSSLWWPSKPNSSAKGTFGERDSSASNADQWRATAVELGSSNSSTSSNTEPSISDDAEQHRIEQDPNLNFWKDVAKGMTEGDTIGGTESDREEE